ncbi:hypothetical protein [Methanobrevibacter sp.]|uniref:hypothetical protein n=1 Tax=Methanobrevibacter sp. TaxID=66852 RepID=UPI0025DFFB9D|nr:hypothetical protein [Methanobrevibacter sp.]MBR4447333.1 hypothetical protein [Methanobrevibacter sp.]
MALSIGFVSANDNGTIDVSLTDGVISQDSDNNLMIEDIDSSTNESSKVIDEISSRKNTKIEAKDIKTYYKEDVELVSYLKDSNNKPLSNKKVSIFINNKIYNKCSNKEGKVVLKLNLKPNAYAATIKFGGDENYSASMVNASVKVDKAPLVICTKNYKTHWHSDLFFKAKILNKITKTPVKGIKVTFKVYMGNNKYKTYYATTNANGIATLKKNFKVGFYKVATSIKKNKNIKSKDSKATLTVKPTEEYGCCSFYVQVSNSESLTGFRRDGTNAVKIHIVKCKWNGRTAVKQYKTNSYFFHTIVTSDGWMVGTGGIDNPTINKGIEKLAGKMVKSGKINKASLKKVQKYERSLGMGHFAIKAPNGKYGLVWGSAIYKGKLKAGEYLSVPNGISSFRHSTWEKFSKNPKDAAIKVAATDPFGINRRGITAFHWKATTTEGKTTSKVKVYAANDNGQLLGRSTGHLKDSIYFGNKFISKNKLPATPSSKYLGKHKFGSIDKLIKTVTTVKAPELTKTLNESTKFKVTVKNKKTKVAIGDLKLKIKISDKVYTVKTNSKGVAKFNASSLDIGRHNVVIYSGNNKYYVSAKSTINII